MIVECWFCGTKGKVDDNKIGNYATCPKCNALIKIPQPALVNSGEFTSPNTKIAP